MITGPTVSICRLAVIVRTGRGVLAKLIDGGCRDRVMTVGQGHRRGHTPRSTAVGLHRADRYGHAGRQVGRGEGDLGKAFGRGRR